MGRIGCYDAEGLRKGAWTAEEDKKLLAYIQEHGEGGWRFLPDKAGLKRCGKSCRLRWANYLRPGIKRGKFSAEEEHKIIELHAVLGNRWSIISRHLPGRTDNEIKNIWNSRLKKRLAKMGINPASSSRSISAPAQLLNKVAAKLVPLGFLDTLKSWQYGQEKLTEGEESSTNNGNDNSGIAIDERCRIESPGTMNMSKSASTQSHSKMASMSSQILLHDPSANTCDIKVGNTCNPECTMWPSGNTLEMPRAASTSSWVLDEIVTKPGVFHCSEENWQGVSSVPIEDYSCGDGSIYDIVGIGGAYDIVSNIYTELPEECNGTIIH
ncbi:hypothetical protein RGQ29_003810 [Quercus rubra]|uniref:Uncharacterized protein n=1 Tax=Quercus rubra TaxID=3512 RepID=A0AAN7IEY1_QUERU|nr:hypothetical protein RGQ29_003810 [Quercus rubra]